MQRDLKSRRLCDPHNCVNLTSSQRLMTDCCCHRRSTQIKTYSWDNAQVLLVGNKCDMEDERVVVAERGRQLSEQLGTLALPSPSPTPPGLPT